MAIPGLFPGNLVLWCILTIVEFGVFCTLWVFTVNVPRMEKPGY